MLQFSLRSLLVMVALIAAWLAGWVSRPKQDAAAIATLERLASSHVIEGGKLIELHTFDPITPRDAELLHRLTDLRTLWLQGDQIRDESLEHLAGLNKLKELHLRSAPITDEGLRSLSGLTGLQKLELTGTRVTDAGLEQLKGMQRLETLLLSGTAVTDKGLGSLETLRSLKIVTLHGTAVSAEGVQRLKRALPGIRVGGAPAPPGATGSTKGTP